MQILKLTDPSLICELCKKPATRGVSKGDFNILLCNACLDKATHIVIVNGMVGSLGDSLVEAIKELKSGAK